MDASVWKRQVELAHYLVNGNLKNKSRVVEKYIREKQRHTINLSTPVPIFIRYFTAEVVNGEFLLHKDVYNKDEVRHDTSLTTMLSGSQK
jgi:murein L,D-transpeptidase YcbB/YkuD